jgi:hypothetical protein
MVRLNDGATDIQTHAHAIMFGAKEGFIESF